MSVKRIIFSLLLLLAPCSSLQAQTSFYQGKTMKLMVGSPAGSTYDQYGRIIAQYIGKHIPGNPPVLVENNPAAGSMVVANFIYRLAAPDGLTLGMIFPSLYFEQIIGRKEAQFDFPRFT